MNIKANVRISTKEVTSKLSRQIAGEFKQHSAWLKKAHIDATKLSDKHGLTNLMQHSEIVALITKSTFPMTMTQTETNDFLSTRPLMISKPEILRAKRLVNDLFIKYFNELNRLDRLEKALYTELVNIVTTSKFPVSTMNRILDKLAIFTGKKPELLTFSLINVISDIKLAK